MSIGVERPDRGEWNAAFAELAAGRGPGVFALVGDGGRVVFTASSGTADLDAPRPIVAEGRFRVASLTRTYLATVVLQLAAEDVLSLDDPVTRWLPDLPGPRPDRRPGR